MRLAYGLTGTDEDRIFTAELGLIKDYEIHTTSDQNRMFMQNHVIAPQWHGTIASEAEMLELNVISAATKGCFEGDEVYRSDTGTVWRCILNRGEEIEEWFEFPVGSGGGGDILTDPAWVQKGDLVVGEDDDEAAILAIGTDGQVLTAASGETLGMKWSTPLNISNDPTWAAKGNLIVASANDTAAVLTVGSNGQSLIADSGQTLGIKWSTLPTLASDTLWAAKGDSVFASANDTAAILTVGSNGQVITADSAQSLGVKWATPVTLATDTLFAAKGDIPIATGNDACVVVTVGANGTVLTADSSQTAGVKWVAPTVYGGFLTDTGWAAKGDIAVGTANDTASIVSIGSTGQVLTVVSGTAAWATPAGGALDIRNVWGWH